jgi:hypothetical protein
MLSMILKVQVQYIISQLVKLEPSERQEVFNTVEKHFCLTCGKDQQREKISIKTCDCY